MSEEKRILIVDDDEDYGNALSIVLENSGYKVEHVFNIKEGREAIDRVNKFTGKNG